jgi:hypothetical protein
MGIKNEMPERQYRVALRRNYAIDLTVNKQLKPRIMQIIISVITRGTPKSQLFPSLLCRNQKKQCDYEQQSILKITHYHP